MTSQKPFRFGLVADKAQSLDEWVAKARRAEELGYDIFLVPDHFWIDVSPVPALMAAAAVTSRIRLGALVFDNDFRNPVLLAQEVATLDVFSRGRFELGLGCGYLPSDYEQSGIPFEAPGVRISRLAESLQLIKRYYTEEEVKFEGTYYKATKLKGTLKPLQKPYPPLFVGGGGKRLLSLAAREADIVGFSANYGPQGLDWASITYQPSLEKLSWIRAAAGERFEKLELGTSIFVIVPTDARQYVVPGMAAQFGLTPEQLLECQHVLIGTPQQMAEELLKRREMIGISYLAITEAALETFAPVVSILSGK